MPAPLDPYASAIAPDRTDCNGHMNLAYHVLAFDRATDAVPAAPALGAALRDAHGSPVFVAATRVVHERELAAGAPLALRQRGGAS